MARKKISVLVQAMTLFNAMDERDRQTMADYIRSQTATPRKAAVKKQGKKPTPVVFPETEDYRGKGTAAF